MITQISNNINLQCEKSFKILTSIITIINCLVYALAMNL